MNPALGNIAAVCVIVLTVVTLGDKFIAYQAISQFQAVSHTEQMKDDLRKRGLLD